MSSRSSKLAGWLTVSLLLFAYIRDDYAKQQAQTRVGDLLACLLASWLFLGTYELVQSGLTKLGNDQVRDNVH